MRTHARHAAPGRSRIVSSSNNWQTERAMSFQPHPAQLQAIRAAKRFREGFRPVQVYGKPLDPNSVLTTISFAEIPAQVLKAEIGHLCADAEDRRFLDDLCNRGYLRKQDGYPKCECAPMEYQTEDGTRIFIYDKDWSHIAVRCPDAKLPNGKVKMRHYLTTQGRIEIRCNAAAGDSVPDTKLKTPVGRSKRNLRREKSGRGSCYELLPDGFQLLDQPDQGTRQTIMRPAWEQLKLYRSADGSDHSAELDGERIRIRGDAALNMLDTLQKKKGERVKALVLQQTLRQRPDKVWKLLDKRLQHIVEAPGKGGAGYAML